MIYFDNASTSYPKPSVMRDWLAHFYDQPIGSYARSGDPHTLDYAMRVEQLRDRLCHYVGGIDGACLVYTKNATEAINMVINGLPHLTKESVLISPMAHNAVTRPLTALEGESFSVMPAHSDGTIDLSALRSMECSDLRLVVITAMSNITGAEEDLDPVCRLVKQRWPESMILIDAAQALPYMQILSKEWGIDFVAITGHKGLLGPTGTGALYVGNPSRLHPTQRGGNGYRSDFQGEILEMPDRYEAGTLNMLGLTALNISLENMPEPLVSKEEWCHYLDRIAGLLGVRVLRANDPTRQGPLCAILSVRYHANELGDLLLKKYQIITRSGVQCAPLAYDTLGISSEGATRISISPYTSHSELDSLLTALGELHLS